MVSLCNPQKIELMFSGSYAPEDVVFLLTPIDLESTDVQAKERRIQAGERHYSEMLTHERAPSPRYLQTFHAALEREQERYVRDVWRLARRLAAENTQPLVLVSLARAGTSLGVLLHRALVQLLGCTAWHYSISIIRERGVDEAALAYILQRHPDARIVFVDGWTGKGAIARELAAAVTRFNQQHGSALDPGLWTIADLCGAATMAATTEDYLIPSCILGATISGLVSRTILRRDLLRPGDFHGCVYYRELAGADLSRWYVDRLFAGLAAQTANRDTCTTAAELAERRRQSEAFLQSVQQRFGVRSLHHVKPGIGEATRVLLRRVPELLWLRERDHPAVAHLCMLAEEKQVPILIEATLPYLATALIKELD